MKEFFETSYQRLMAAEGAYTHLPGDEPTIWGVRKSIWEAFTQRPWTLAEFKQLTPQSVKSFYYQQYWQACLCDLLPTPLDYLTFDFAVHSGPVTAIYCLQKSTKSLVDGRIGPVTLGNILRSPLLELCSNYLNERLNYIKKTRLYPLYKKGWNNRISELKNFCKTIIKS